MKRIIKIINDEIPPNSRDLKNLFSIFIFNESFLFIIHLRLGIFFYKSKYSFVRLLSRIIKKRIMRKWSSDISMDIELGKHVSFGHPTGIVIGNKAQIGNNVKIWQQVTLGSHGKKNQSKTYPTIKDNVRIYAGAKVIGGITIGENAILGANAVVNIDVPDNCIAVGVPCKIISKNEK